jgi:hypothetical protein
VFQSVHEQVYLAKAWQPFLSVFPLYIHGYLQIVPEQCSLYFASPDFFGGINSASIFKYMFILLSLVL